MKNYIPSTLITILNLKVDSELEMSDFSSHNQVREENSNCESQSDSENRINDKVEKVKNLRKRKDRISAVNMSNDQTDDDETESQLQYEERVSSSINSPFMSHVSTHYQEKMRRRLQFFFMNPIEKWHAKKR